MKHRSALFMIITLVAGLAAGDPARAQDDEFAPEHITLFSRARILMTRERFDEAREVYAEILSRYGDVPAVRDRAVAASASTYLAEGRYRRAALFMEDHLRDAGGAMQRTRVLYAGLEQRVDRALSRARRALRRAEEEYDEISWWNIFRIFEKFERRRDRNQAEEDVEELERLSRMFLPELLFPEPMPATEEEHGEGGDTGDDQASTGDGSEDGTDAADDGAEDEASAPGDSDTAAAEEAVAEAAKDQGETASEEPADEGGDEEPAASEDGEEPAEEEASEDEATTVTDVGEVDPKKRAMDVLADEIAALVALIPEDRIALADEILGSESSPSAPVSTAALSESPSEETTGEPALEPGDEEASAEVTELTTGSAEASEDTSAAASVEMLGGSGGGDPDEDGDKSAEATVTTTETAAPPAPVRTAQDLRQDYFDAYNRLQQALRGGDAEAIRVAREEYMLALQTMRNAQYGILNNGQPEGTPSAPGSSDGGAPSAPAPLRPNIQAPPPGVNATSGVVRPDRSGTVRGMNDGGLRSSRGSFHR